MRHWTQSALLLALAPISGAFALSFTPLPAGDFSLKHYADVPLASPHFSAVRWATVRGLVTGNPDGTFTPDAPLNRAAAVTMLLRHNPDCAADLLDSKRFLDVETSAWFAPAVHCAEQKNIAKGYADGTFGPAKTVTLGEAAAFITRAVEYDMTAVPVADDCQEWWCAPLYALHHANAMPMNVSSVHQSLTRAQFVHILYSIHTPNPNRETPSPSQLYPVIFDSNFTREEALALLPAEVPQAVRAQQELLTVEYVGFDGKKHRGQVLIDQRLAADIEGFFQLANELQFPFEAVVLGHEQGWDDNVIMSENLTTAFNWRLATGLNWVSHHGYGFAFDVNPRLNPYYKNGQMLPPNGTYDPNAPGTLTANHPLVQYMRARGWGWGGDWATPKDYQHFQKLLY